MSWQNGKSSSSVYERELTPQPNQLPKREKALSQKLGPLNQSLSSIKRGQTQPLYPLSKKELEIGFR